MKILRISPYSVRMRVNANQNNSEYGEFLRKVKLYILFKRFGKISCAKSEFLSGCHIVDDKSNLSLSLPQLIFACSNSNRNTRKRSEICSKLKILTYKHVSHLFLMFLLLILNKYMLADSALLFTFLLL